LGNSTGKLINGNRPFVSEQSTWMLTMFTRNLHVGIEIEHTSNINPAWPAGPYKHTLGNIDMECDLSEIDSLFISRKGVLISRV